MSAIGSTESGHSLATYFTSFFTVTVKGGGKVKEADLYSAFIEVPYTQGAQVMMQINLWNRYKCRTKSENADLLVC